MPRWYTRPKTVTHPGTNRARRALTSSMRRTPLTTTPRRQPRCPSASVRVCLESGVLSNRLKESSWFLARERPSTDPILPCKKIRLALKIRVLPSGAICCTTCSTVDKISTDTELLVCLVAAVASVQSNLAKGRTTDHQKGSVGVCDKFNRYDI